MDVGLSVYDLVRRVQTCPYVHDHQASDAYRGGAIIRAKPAIVVNWGCVIVLEMVILDGVTYVPETKSY